MTLAKFDPPAFMDDLDRVPNGREQWDAFLGKVFDFVVGLEGPKYAPGATVQYFNPKKFDVTGPLIEQPILWNAFPKTMVLNLGRDRALVEADQLVPYDPVNTFPTYPKTGFNQGFDPTLPANAPVAATSMTWCRQTDEYCEWRVERDAATGKISKITFTSEPPEYWQAIFGGTVSLTDTVNFTFTGAPEVAAEIYAELLGRDHIDPDDLRATHDYNGITKGDYDPYNKWNTTLGICHLCCPPNSIAAEVQLGGDATVLYQRPDGETVTNPDELICRAAYGGVNRNSDPTIGATVNSLARAGAMITLANPVGLYMDNIDLAGWELPDGIKPQDCVKVVRGGPGRIERLVVEVPPETGRFVSDIRIGGEPVRYGGQVAECITIKLVGAAGDLGKVRNAPIKATWQGLLRRTDPAALFPAPAGALLPGFEPAFVPASISPPPPLATAALIAPTHWAPRSVARGVR